MNRIEFMAELEALLSDISEEERREAIQYYKDYFEDAGMENEMEIIKELGTPEKVAATIKDGLNGGDASTGEYRETGYTDTKYEKKEVPSRTVEEKPKYGAMNTILKVILITLIILVGGPVIVPLVIGLVCVVLGIIIAIGCLLFGLLIAAVAVAFSGVFLFGVGVTQLFSMTPAGLVLMGGGLMLLAGGTGATAFLGKGMLVILPGIFRGAVNLFSRMIHRKAVSS